mmetsp:Transcript_3244/g.7496  ORF Transcript_3244/g.7496 Transcript_3244/m.7496 type:complete len:380 (-) Transcript_3244:304-1443(-)
MKLTSVALLLSVAGASARFTPLKPESLAVRSAGSKDAALEFRGGAVKPASKAVSVVQKGGFSLAGIDWGLLSLFAFWFLGNYYYNIWNKQCLKASGGSAGFPLTISVMQLGVGVVYACLCWCLPFIRKLPTTTQGDLIKMFPVAFTNLGAHSASVFAMGAGAVSFAQIVKASEPAFAAVLSVLFYGKKVSLGKWLMLPIIIGGVILASVKELDFAWSALIAACVANCFAAFKANENKKLIEAEGIKDRIGSVGNQFALTTMIAFLASIPVAIIREGHRWGEFVTAFNTNPAIKLNLILSGLWFYGYNELATMTLKKTGAVTQSVANTAKRVIVIVGVAIVMGESLDPLKLLGCSIGIGGVFLYSIIDDLVKKKPKEFTN